ncbi:MAG TPA: competence/damage-inducible protein A [Longimicrobiales bacterium]
MSRTRPALEIVAIGDELLLGQTIDTNSAWLARELAQHGIRVVRGTTTGDDERAIRDAVGGALERTGAVVCTGGLGPTRDDLTRPVVASMFGRALRIDDDVLAALEARFRRIGREMSPLNRCQAEVPEGALVLPNANGTAPGLILTDDDDRFVVLLPGVPREMRGLFEDHLLPWLLERWPERDGPVCHRVIRTTGIAESKLAELLEPALAELNGLGVAYLPSPSGVDVRLTSWGDRAPDAAERDFDRIEGAVRSIAGRWIYTSGAVDIVDAVGDALRRRGWTVAAAESCTGGLIGKRLTDRAGSSDYMLGGIVAYANEVKVESLGVPAALIAAHGAVSEPVAAAMARGAIERLHADCAVAVTGIAGPGGGTESKPVGTVCIAARTPDAERMTTIRSLGDRAEVRERASQAALALLLDMLHGESR